MFLGDESDAGIQTSDCLNNRRVHTSQHYQRNALSFLIILYHHHSGRNRESIISASCPPHREGIRVFTIAHALSTFRANDLATHTYNWPTQCSPTAYQPPSTSDLHYPRPFPTHQPGQRAPRRRRLEPQATPTTHQEHRLHQHNRQRRQHSSARSVQDLGASNPRPSLRSCRHCLHLHRWLPALQLQLRQATTGTLTETESYNRESGQTALHIVLGKMKVALKRAKLPAGFPILRKIANTSRVQHSIFHTKQQYESTAICASCDRWGTTAE